MEPLMSFEGYRVIEDTNKSRNMLDSFYESRGYTVDKPDQSEKISKKKPSIQKNSGTSQKD